MKTSRGIVAAVAMVGCAALLSGCTGGSAENYPGLPPKSEVAQSSSADSGIQAFWLDEGAEIAVAIWGSSTCPRVGNSIEVVKEAGKGNAVAIGVAPVPNKPCTADLVPHTTVFGTPGQITTTEPLEIRVLDQVVVLPIK